MPELDQELDHDDTVDTPVRDDVDEWNIQDLTPDEEAELNSTVESGEQLSGDEAGISDEDWQSGDVDVPSAVIDDEEV